MEKSSGKIADLIKDTPWLPEVDPVWKKVVRHKDLEATSQALTEQPKMKLVFHILEVDQSQQAGYEQNPFGEDHTW